MKRRAESGPHEAPVIFSDKLYTELFDLIPGACLFTIIEPASQSDDMELGSQQDQCCEGRTSEHNEQQQGGKVEEHTGEQNNQHDRIQDREEDDQQFTGGNEEQRRGQDTDLQDGENIEDSTLLQSSDFCSLQCEESLLPLPLPEYFKEASRTINEIDTLSTAEQLFYSLVLSEDDCSRIESCTRDQRNSDEWYRQRQGRLTASDFHKIYAMQKQTNPTTVVRRLLSKPNISHIPAIRWGVDHEDLARQDYIKEMSTAHINFKCVNAGLMVNHLYPHLGASPDGFVQCDCCPGKGLLEIKCPFTAKDSHPNDLRGKPRSCLGVNGVITSHAYYTQIQGQLVIADRQYCDLVVWTTQGITMERVLPDVNFTEKLLTKLTTFYVNNIIQELVTEHPLEDTIIANSPPSTESPLYCFCQKEESGKMIMCEGSHCPYTWFHFPCVGIKRTPKGSWFCSDCKNS